MNLLLQCQGQARASYIHCTIYIVRVERATFITILFIRSCKVTWPLTLGDLFRSKSIFGRSVSVYKARIAGQTAFISFGPSRARSFACSVLDFRLLESGVRREPTHTHRLRLIALLGHLSLPIKRTSTRRSILTRTKPVTTNLQPRNTSYNPVTLDNRPNDVLKFTIIHKFYTITD